MSLDKSITVISTEDHFKDARQATDMNRVDKESVKYFNSNERGIEEMINLGKNYNNLMNQVVGCEGRTI